MKVIIKKTTIESEGESAKLGMDFEFQDHTDLNLFLEALHNWFKAVSGKEKDSIGSPTIRRCC